MMTSNTKHGIFGMRAILPGSIAAVLVLLFAGCTNLFRNMADSDPFNSGVAVVGGSRNGYVVTFDVNHTDARAVEGGNYAETRAKPPGFSVDVWPKTPVRQGSYAFDGWNTQADGNGEDFDPNYKIRENIAVYAMWKPTGPDMYRVFFEENGGSPVIPNPLLVKSGDPAIALTTTMKDNNFEGWFEDDVTFNEPWDFSTPITEKLDGLRLYASWSLVMRNVEFDTMGGDHDIAKQSVRNGEKASRPPDPVKTGHVFDDWYATPTGSTKFDFNSAITENTIIYARWIAQHTVKFDTMGGSAVTDQMVNHGSRATKPANSPTLASHGFVDWYTTTTGDVKFDFNSAITENTIIYARWIAQHTVKFDTMGGSVVQDRTVNHGAKVSRPSNPIKIGFTFDDWYTTTTGSARFDFDSAINGPMMIFARWTADKWKVTFNLNGGTGGQPDPQQVDQGGKATRPGTAPTMTGHTFDDWYSAVTGGVKFDFNQVIGADVTIHARWIKNQYNVSFNLNGGTGGSTGQQLITYGNKATRPGTAPTRANYDFVNWYTAASGGNVFDFNSPITQVTVIHAQWKLKEYTVKFNTQGGSSVSEQKVSHGSRASKPNNPTKDFWKFEDWFNADKFGKPWDFNTPITGDTTIYAQWRFNLVPHSYKWNWGGNWYTRYILSTPYGDTMVSSGTYREETGNNSFPDTISTGNWSVSGNIITIKSTTGTKRDFTFRIDSETKLYSSQDKQFFNRE